MSIIGRPILREGAREKEGKKCLKLLLAAGAYEREQASELLVANKRERDKKKFVALAQRTLICELCALSMRDWDEMGGGRQRAPPDDSITDIGGKSVYWFGRAKSASEQASGTNTTRANVRHQQALVRAFSFLYIRSVPPPSLLAPIQPGVMKDYCFCRQRGARNYYHYNLTNFYYDELNIIIPSGVDITSEWNNNGKRIVCRDEWIRIKRSSWHVRRLLSRPALAP